MFLLLLLLLLLFVIVCLFVCLFWCCCFLTKKTIKRLNSHAAGSEKSEPFWHRVLNSGFFLSEDYRLYSIELAFGACGLGSGNGWSKYYEKHAENFPCEKRNVKMICLALLSNPLFIFFFFFSFFFFLFFLSVQPCLLSVDSAGKKRMVKML